MQQVPCTGNCGVEYHIAGTVAAQRCGSMPISKTGRPLPGPSPLSPDASEAAEIVPADSRMWDDIKNVENEMALPYSVGRDDHSDELVLSVESSSGEDKEFRYLLNGEAVDGSPDESLTGGQLGKTMF